MTLPNKLTLGRLALTMVFVVALLGNEGAYLKTAALAIFIIASLTDWLDGWLARTRGLETTFGALLDPLADKVLVAAAFICFIELENAAGGPLVPAWMVLLIISREFLVTGLRLVAREQHVVLKAERLGKHKTISQMITIIVILLGLAAREDWGSIGFDPERFDAGFAGTVLVMLTITVVLTIWSGAAYFWKNRKLFLQHA